MSAKFDDRILNVFFQYEVAPKIRGCQEPITINTGIYGQCLRNSGYNISKDLITVEPPQNSCIGYDELQIAFDYIMNQFNSVSECDRSHSLRNVNYNSHEKKMEFVWGR